MIKIIFVNSELILNFSARKITWRRICSKCKLRAYYVNAINEHLDIALRIKI